MSCSMVLVVVRVFYSAAGVVFYRDSEGVVFYNAVCGKRVVFFSVWLWGFSLLVQ